MVLRADEARAAAAWGGGWGRWWFTGGLQLGKATSGASVRHWASLQDYIYIYIYSYNFILFLIVILPVKSSLVLPFIECSSESIDLRYRKTAGNNSL